MLFTSYLSQQAGESNHNILVGHIDSNAGTFPCEAEPTLAFENAGKPT